MSRLMKQEQEERRQRVNNEEEERVVVNVQDQIGYTEGDDGQSTSRQSGEEDDDAYKLSGPDE